jgi:catechol 2,3-dioxygenase-like lactoylglutathione lyase family enzyme
VQVPRDNRSMPRVSAVIETCLYVDDLRRARRFYVETLGFESIFDDTRACALNVGGRSVLLLFARGQSTESHQAPGGRIPPHDGSGPVHIGFAVNAAELEAWQARLHERGIAIESSVEWPRGGRSIYFRDPDGHLVEFLTPGVWTIY